MTKMFQILHASKVGGKNAYEFVKCIFPDSQACFAKSCNLMLSRSFGLVTVYLLKT